MKLILVSISGFHVGDMLVQLFFFLFILLMVVLVISLILSSKKRKNKLDRLEEKIDSLHSKINK
ncbi:hypothetical protein [Paucisalibacillus sp. EB02]|uniref:hypothetical protein n=1 Tax=Paucisalibacillus sp. EB02 TaxID=1347087 RepID=UPI0004B9A7FA|nr:hypothetical protein [Paucisalibacillus sp. EB02]